MNEAAEFGPAALWLTGALSSAFSILTSAVVTEWFQRHRERQQAVRRITQDLRMNLRLIDSWLEMLGTPLDRGAGPIVPSMRSLSELGASTSSLQADIVDRLRYLEMAIEKLPEQSSHTDRLIERLSNPGAKRSLGDLERLIEERRQLVLGVRFQIERALVDLEKAEVPSLPFRFRYARTQANARSRHQN